MQSTNDNREQLNSDHIHVNIHWMKDVSINEILVNKKYARRDSVVCKCTHDKYPKYFFYVYFDICIFTERFPHNNKVIPPSVMVKACASHNPKLLEERNIWKFKKSLYGKFSSSERFHRSTKSVKQIVQSCIKDVITTLPAWHKQKYDLRWDENEI